MELCVHSPLGILLEQDILSVTVETLDGYYTLLPKHVDFAAVLTSGIVSYKTLAEQEKYLACHQGIVVKKAGRVTISVQGGILADSLPELQQQIALEAKQNEQQRKELNTAMARLELGVIRGFQKLKGDADGGI